MIKEIETVDDIRVFARQLITEDVSFPRVTILKTYKY